jgi:hypothetical protein
MKYSQAIRTLRNGKKKKTSKTDLTAAAKVVNAQYNRFRINRLKRLGYSESEANNLVYATP